MAYTTINKSGDYFNTKLYTGNGSTQSITGVGFQPDLNWTKGRNVGTFHMLTDAVRGVTKAIQSNTTTAEQTFASGLTSFNSDGFTAGNSDDINGNYNYASWNWKANGTGSANTDGTISSTVSANTTSGFSIVSWTGNATAGATIGHGLGVTPKVIILKGTDQTDGWFVQHQDLGATKFLRLQDTNAVTTQTNVWNDTAPTSNVFSVGNGSGTNGNGNQFITYCFAEKTGYSKFGSFTGNNNADGTFVYTGFKPAFVMIKRTDNTSNWLLYDNKREGYNQANDYLNPDNSNAEGGGDNYLDLLSNGFKTRVASQSINVSGASYIYMAFAEAPLVGTNNVPCTAR
jgi:hypothetical protein